MPRTRRLPAVPPLTTRRHALALPLVLAGGALAACGQEAPVVPGGPASGGSTATGSTPPSGSAAASAAPLTRVEGVLGGHSLDVRVGPLVRYNDAISVLVLHAERPADDPLDSPSLDLATSWAGTIADDLFGTRPLRLIDPATSRVWVTTLGADLAGGVLAPGESADLHPTFGGVEEGTDSVVVMLARTGFFEVEVVGRDRAGDIDLDGVVRDAVVDEARAAPLGLERYTEAADDSASELTTDEDVTLTVASDVTFAPSSATLTEQADAILQDLASTVAAYPDGGDLAITGHTDDVDEEAYNQTLSEQRAQAVSDRVGALTDLSAWTVAVAGKGESEPKVAGTDDAARAANRRVELVLTPTGGTSPGAGSAGPGSQDAMPDTSGPTGVGPQGVEAPTEALLGDPLTIRLDQVTRRSGLLLGEFVVTGGAGAVVSGWFTDGAGYGLTNARGEAGTVVSSIAAASGVTLLNGGNRLFPVDYLPDGAQSHRPLAELDLTEILHDGASSKVLVVWPDTGQDTVVVDRPEDATIGAAPWRLTEVPVVEA